MDLVDVRLLGREGDVLDLVPNGSEQPVINEAIDDLEAGKVLRPLIDMALE